MFFGFVGLGKFVETVKDQTKQIVEGLIDWLPMVVFV